MSRVGTGLLLGILLFPVTAGAAWDGVLDWARRTEMSTAASGVVEKVLVRAGERVKKNTVLLQLEQATLRARVRQAKAAVQHARLLRDEAERERDRAQELYDRTLLADHDLNVAKLTFAEADVSYQRASADFEAVEEGLRDSELRAPFDALILDRLVQPSQTVVNQLSAEPMLVVASSTEMLVRITVQADEIKQFAPGKKVVVKCEGKKYQGVVGSLRLDSQIGSGGSLSSGYTVEVLFATDANFLPGTSASVNLP